MELQEFKNLALNLQDDIVKWRRHIHQHPEIGEEVPQTSKYIADQLRKMGVEVLENVGGMGVVGIIRGEKSGKTFAVRADIDALLVQEETDLPFASVYDGRMHACGHDAHVAIALATAQILNSKKHNMSGNVKMIFQPAEEGIGGAEPMIKDGALKNPDVDAIVGLHVGVIWDVPLGAFGFKAGPLMACSDRFNIKIKGRGGHGAMPHKTVDAIVVGCKVVEALQNIVSRRIDPLESAVVSVGTFKGGSAENVISETVEIAGTTRCLSSQLRGELPKLMEQIVKGITFSMGAEYELSYKLGYPVVENDPQMTEFMSQTAVELFDESTVKKIEKPSLGGEDMAYFLQEVPGTFFALGTGNSAKKTDYPHHNPRFDVDEAVLWKGAALFAAAAFRFLQLDND